MLLKHERVFGYFDEGMENISFGERVAIPKYLLEVFLIRKGT